MTDPQAPLRLLDTSVIVRYLTNDIPGLAGQARTLIESQAPLGITTVAILEAAYVLGRAPYNFPRDAIVDTLSALVQRNNMRGIGVVPTYVAAALGRCKGSSAISFGDALLAATGWSAGVAEIYTFDARFSRTGLRSAPLPSSDTA